MGSLTTSELAFLDAPAADETGPIRITFTPGVPLAAGEMVTPLTPNPEPHTLNPKP